jgi:hypothetical protein
MHHNIASAFDGMKIDGAFVYGLRIEQHSVKALMLSLFASVMAFSPAMPWSNILM